MSWPTHWTVALGEPAPELRALAGERVPVEPARADVVLWPARRRRVLPAGDALHVFDLRGADPAALRLDGAGLLLVGSAAAYGAWAARAPGVPIAVVPPVAGSGGVPAEAMAALHILAGPERDAEAAAAASWAAARGLDCGVAEGPAGLLARLGPAPPLAPGAVALDVRTGAARTEASPALLALLAAGAPVLFGEDTPLLLALETAGAAWRFEAVGAGLERVAGLGGVAFGRASAAALQFAATRFGAAGAQAAFERAVDGALAGQRAAALPRIGHVLVISDEGANLRHIRVHQPFDALLARGVIAGYSVLCGGAWVFSTADVTPALRFGAIWVQRSVDAQVLLLLRSLDRPFAYDLDDNLLVSPAYRPAFDAEATGTAAALIRGCAVLSCATHVLAERLAGTVAEVGAGVGERTVVTPNLAYGPARRTRGTARTVVWASSDVPALAGSRVEVERAVRDFCRTQGLALLCIGEAPPATFAAAGLCVEHEALLPYPDYMERLRAAAPGILVGPLETGADGETQAFVDCKSDIKVIEAGMAGLCGVFSRATPYAESDLGSAILCANSYEGWTEGLQRARAACQAGEAAAEWPAWRDAGRTGLRPWAAALARAATEVSAGEVEAALRFVRGQAEALLPSPALFDEKDYLRRHPDVAGAVTAGVVASGYRHFAQSGFREGRAARAVPTGAGAVSFWWTRLLHEVGGLEQAVAAREGEIVALRERLAMRRRLNPAAMSPAATRTDNGTEVGRKDVTWLQWGGTARSLPCPVCSAAGPHEAVLRANRTALLRCAGCGTCFYADRSEHEYAGGVADTALQFSLEQNASIHHQTRLLFGAAEAGSVLDVGCGFGFAVDLAARVLGWQAVGVDPSAAAAAGGVQLGADIRVGYLRADTELGPPFDRVLASEVIEHVADPYATLALLRARVAPGGVLAVTTPNAAAIERNADEGRLLGILAPGVHLTLFTEWSLAVALRGAGFAHVRVEATADSLLAEASDWPLRPGTEAAHGPAYRAYLEGLMRRAPAGSPLWNGAVGRLLALLVGSEAVEVLDALFATLGACWAERFGIDLHAPRLPPALSEREIATIGAVALGQRQPFNLGPVLLCRAELEERRPGRAPGAALAWALPAYRVAVETRRVLQAENMVDLDLKRTAWRARLLVLSSLVALAPALEGTLRRAGATASPGRQADWDDPPPAAAIGFVAGFFAEAMAEDRFDDARRVWPWVADAEAVVAALADDPALLLRALFMRGVLLLVADRDGAGAEAAFERLGHEARRLGAADYQAIAATHLVLVRDRGGGASMTG